MSRTSLIVMSVVAALAVSGCASSRKSPFETPRLAKVVEVVPMDSPDARVMSGIGAGRSAVLAGIVKHTQEGGTLHPASMGPAVGGIVDDTRAAVNDSCTRTFIVELEDNGKRLGVHTRCDRQFEVGQKVSIVQSKGSFDLRDILQVTAVQ